MKRPRRTTRNFEQRLRPETRGCTIHTRHNPQCRHCTTNRRLRQLEGASR